MKIFFQITVTLIFLVISSGCWNQRELNDLGIAMSLGIDKVEDEIKVTIQVVLPQEVTEPSYYTPVTVYTQTAETVFEAFRKMTTEAPRKIYLSHFRTLVISEALARDGIIEILDMMIRDHEFRSDFLIVVAKEGIKSEDVLEIMTPFEKIPANEMFSSLQTSEAAWAPTVNVTLDELLTNLVTEGKEPVLSGITIINSNIQKGKSVENVQKTKPNSLLKTTNVGVFKGDKLVGWLNEDESKGFNYVTGNIESTVGKIKCPKEGELVIEVKAVDAKIKPQLKNGKPEIEIEITVNANIGEVLCDIDLTDSDVIKELEINLEERVEELMQCTIQKAQQQFKSDIFGFGNTIHKKFPKKWKDLKANWDDEFARLPVTYSVEGVIDITGTIDQSFYKQFKDMEAD